MAAHSSVRCLLILIAYFFTYLTAADNNYLVQPQQIYTYNNESKQYNLTVTKHIAHIEDAHGRIVGETEVRTYSYDGVTRYAGPTLRVKRGTTVHVNLINNLTGVGKLTEILNTTMLMQMFKNPDIANLHVHGMHVSPVVDSILLWTNPKCPSIDAMKEILSTDITSDEYLHIIGGLDCVSPKLDNPATHSVQSYPYVIPYDHYPGTHWYHDHVHGATAFHIIQGLFGFMIVEDMDKYSPEIQFEWEEVQLLISYSWMHTSDVCFGLTNNLTMSPHDTRLLYTRPDNPSTAYPFQFPIQSMCFIYSRMYNQQLFPISILDKNYTQLQFSDVNIHVDVNSDDISKTEMEEIESVNGTQLFLINGQIRPVLKMYISKWYHFRMVNTIMNYLFFWIRNDSVSNATYIMCDFHVIAQDGIYFPRTRPRNLYSYPYQDNQVVLPPGSRADLAVRCDCHESVGDSCKYDIWGYGQRDTYKYGFVPMMMESIPILYLEVTNDGNGLADMSDFEDWIPQPHNMSNYLKDTRDNDQTSYFCTTDGFIAEEMSQCNIVHGRREYPSGIKNKWMVSINQVAFSTEYSLTKICTNGETHEWMVTSNFHPFHHHTWPFQLQRDITHGWFALEGDWRDVMGSAGTFRMRSNYFVPHYSWNKGKLIVHCHFVPHEDLGMIAQIGFMGISECEANKNKYIHTSELGDGELVTSDIVIESYSDSNHKCTELKANIKIIALNVDMNATIIATVNKHCTLELNIKVKPRSMQVGNFWFSLGFGGSYMNHKITRDEYYVVNNAISMDGIAIVFSFQSDGVSSCTKMYTSEVLLSNILRTTTKYDGHSFDCHSYTVEDTNLHFVCTHDLMSGKNAFSALNEKQNFIWAYGEGRFVPNVTYHSSRGGCTLDYNTVDGIECIHSQNQLSYYLTEKSEASSAVLISEYSSYIIIIYTSVGLLLIGFTAAIYCNLRYHQKLCLCRRQSMKHKQQIELQSKIWISDTNKDLYLVETSVNADTNGLNAEYNEELSEDSKEENDDSKEELLASQ